MLKNLNDLIHKCRDIFDILPRRVDIYLNEELRALLQKALIRAEPDSTFQFRDYSIELANSDGLKADIPSTWLWYGYAFHEFKDALNDYQNFIKELKEYFKNLGFNAKQIDTFLKNFPKEGDLVGNDRLLNTLNEYVSNHYTESEQELIYRFLTQRDWWFVPQKKTKQTTGKTLERTDIFKSSFYLACRVIVANSDRLTTVAEAFVNSPELTAYFDSLDLQAIEKLQYKSEIPLESIAIDKKDRQAGYNKIYYGAPGTGKSYKIKNEVGRARQIRTVFHPDTQYSDFVGSLKPKTVSSNKAEAPIITYEFRPGPFTKAFIEAEKVKNILEPVYLVIEEINRASAAAVFGELFQLLDRKANGSSEYEIELSDPDMLEYINSQLPAPITTLSLPPNLFLIATMNSSDQAVKPMDAAFKRRWSFEYIQIDYAKATLGNLMLPSSSGLVNIKWANFAEIINQRLQNLGVPEDRLLGHRFLSDLELSTPEAAVNSLCGKLFVYLWDDVLRHGRREIIFNTSDFGTFGALVNGFRNGCFVFSKELEDDFSSVVETIFTTEE
ncbi:AAA family ATPase [Vibrio cholerae]|nr:AAA family ATPase [Vibrio cholerae]EJL6562072.1 AAA family ATPase [Vibrio cholerae]